jgi:hypothetical protein
MRQPAISTEEAASFANGFFGLKGNRHRSKGSVLGKKDNHRAIAGHAVPGYP